MKKILKFCLIFFILIQNINLIFSCQKRILKNKTVFNELNLNYDNNIDLLQNYLPNENLIQYCGYKGTLFYQYKNKIIKKITDAFLSKINILDNQSLIDFNFLQSLVLYEDLEFFLTKEQQKGWKNLLSFLCPKY